MSNLKKEIIQIHIPSELGYEKIPISAAAIAARKVGFSKERIENLKMAVGEAVTNAIEHGNQLNAEARVKIVLTLHDKSLIVKVIDQGQQPIPEIPTQREARIDNRGWGMLLIKDLVDEVAVQAVPGRNEVKMVIHLDQR
jgi:serine/threonine-protein kinase RsbW